MTSLFQDPSFWVSLAFVFFVAFFAKVLWKKAALALDSYGDSIRKQLQESSQLREDAQKALATQKRRKLETAEHIQAILQDAKKKAQRITEQTRKEAQLRLARMEKHAQESATHLKIRATERVRDHITTLALEKAASVLESHSDTYLVESVIEQLEKDGL